MIEIRVSDRPLQLQDRSYSKEILNRALWKATNMVKKMYRETDTLFDMEMLLPYINPFFHDNAGGAVLELNKKEEAYLKWFAHNVMNHLDDALHLEVELSRTAAYTYEEGHMCRVGNLAVELGEQVGLPEEQLTDVFYGSIVHDIGKTEEKFKVYLDNENEIREISLLEITKKSPLTRLEKAMARGHVATGQKKLMYKAPKIIEMIAMLHSENYNGTGYLRYTQNMIRNVFNCPPEIINVVAVADEFDTKISRDYQLDRSHSAKSFYLDLGATIEHMQKCAIEETLNPAYVDAFLGLLQDDRSLTARTIRHMKERNG